MGCHAGRSGRLLPPRRHPAAGPLSSPPRLFLGGRRGWAGRGRQHRRRHPPPAQLPLLLLLAPARTAHPPWPPPPGRGSGGPAAAVAVAGPGGPRSNNPSPPRALLATAAGVGVAAGGGVAGGGRAPHPAPPPWDDSFARPPSAAVLEAARHAARVAAAVAARQSAQRGVGSRRNVQGAAAGQPSVAPANDDAGADVGAVHPVPHSRRRRHHHRHRPAGGGARPLPKRPPAWEAGALLAAADAVLAEQVVGAVAAELEGRVGVGWRGGSGGAPAPEAPPVTGPSGVRARGGEAVASLLSP